ncbi:hypothetical protein QR680_002444 [Steinernema hermaphroditum]|uniref:serine--tRNA ligase n=1 Tax=Steinernema hermaphroditum TaxID=289476 RepID=A0AA39LIC3_9BILA|nr:hypothetical protein QR680_002444 [Steinernema hermaphroditum]
MCIGCLTTNGAISDQVLPGTSVRVSVLQLNIPPFRDLLLTVEHLAYRIASDKKPVGTLHLYGDRIEWNEDQKPPTVSVGLSEIERQRVSRSPKSVAIQFVLRNGNTLSFHFVNPDHTRDELLAERDQFVEILQHVLGEQLEAVSTLISQVESCTPEKEEALCENKYLKDLYRHLVLTKLVKPNEFWADYMKENEKSKEEDGGVSGAFLTSLIKAEGTNGLKLTLSRESIQNIFKIFPSVERRHEELVPKQLSEEKFWEKFFHSYYFNRNRPASSSSDKNDPFLACITADDADMRRIIENAYVKKTLDESTLRDDLGVITPQESENMDNKRDSTKALLIRRCNYQSGRILQTALGDRWQKLVKQSCSDGTISVKASDVDDNNLGPSTSNSGTISNKSVLDDSDIVVDSTNLAYGGIDMERYLAGVDLDGAVSYREKTVPSVEAKRIRSLMQLICKPKRRADHVERYKAMMETGDDPLHIPDKKLSKYADNFNRLNDLSRSQIVELMAVNDSCYELIKRFWDFFPPQSAEMEKKLKEMVETLKKYKMSSLVPLNSEYGAHNMEGIISLVDNAVACYQKYLMLGTSSRTTLCLWRRLACSSVAVSTRAIVRPDLDFDYLLDEANLLTIKRNIASRKGVGDIDAVHSTWKEIRNFDIATYNDATVAEEKYTELWEKLYDEALLIPNVSHEDAPEGDESAARMVRTIGPEKREGNLLTAEALVKGWRSLFFPTAASGNRSYAFFGGLSNLEKQLLNYAHEKVVSHGFKPVIVPDLVEKSITAACGVIQRENQTNIQYALKDNADLCLSGTAEMGFGALLRGKVIKEEDLPMRLVAVSRCFRPEISKSASEAKLYRVHEFTKVEMFIVCKPEESDEELEGIVNIQTGIFEELGLHCRLLDMPTHELGAPASRKFDIEAWMPGRKVFGEVSSASNCTDFQARRLNLLVKAQDGSRYHPHTCNGTALASTRAMVALLETMQTKNKGLQLPECLGRSSRTKPFKQQSASPFMC